jgi:hypothetical protein
MAKAKTLQKQKKYYKDLKTAGFEKHSLIKGSKKTINGLKKSFLVCLGKGDLESASDIFDAILLLTNKSALSKKAKIGRQTLYNESHKNGIFGFTIDTVAKVFAAIDESINEDDKQAA